MGNPTFCFSFTSDEFDIYHVADFMGPRGWRFNGQQYPNAIACAVARTAAPARRRGDVRHRPCRGRRVRARNRRPADRRRPGRSTEDPGGLTDELEGFIVMVMEGMLDQQQSVPSLEDVQP